MLPPLIRNTQLCVPLRSIRTLTGLSRLPRNVAYLTAGHNSQLNFNYSNLIKRIQSTRYVSDETISKDMDLGQDDDVDNTGVILQDRSDSLFYFDHLFPYKTSRFDIRPLISGLFFSTSEEALKERILALCHNPDKAFQLQIKDFKVVRRDGGAFVNFRIPPDTTTSEFNKCLMETVKSHSNDSIHNQLTKPRCFPVKGVPWIEDLRRYPSFRIKIAFDGPDLSQEDLYLLFRRYGEIADIVPPRADSKDIPRSAFISFRSIRSGITARYCITGLKVDNTVLHIHYERVVKPNTVLNFINQHQRIFIPILIALAAAFAVVIFDPIRHFFISEKITSDYSIAKHFEGNAYYKMARNAFTSTRNMLFSGNSSNAEDYGGIHGMWSERVAMAKDISLWIEENSNTFIVLQGPRGSGKRSLIQDTVLKDRQNVLYFDCETVLKSRKDTVLLESVAQQIGYYPIFAWLGNFSKFIDLIVQGLTGQNSGLSESKELQVKNMLIFSSSVIRDVALRKYRKVASDNCSKDLPVPKEDDYLQQNPDDKPVVVIDRFLAAKNANDPNAFIYKELANWASTLIAMNAAHVIFLTDDVGSMSVLNDSMPNSVFKKVIISDASSESAQKYVLQRLHHSDGKLDLSTPEKEKELLESIVPFGGRMLDLQMFTRRVISGEDPSQALKGMISQTLEQLNQIFVSPEKQVGFTSAQAWCIMKILAEKDVISYQEIYNLPLFKANSPKVLDAMENAGLISLVRTQGLISAARPAKPIFKSAFSSMIENKKMFQTLEIDYLNTLIKTETAKIGQYEDELTKYSVSEIKMFKDRLQYLGDKISASTNNIRDYEKRVADLSKPIA